MDRWFKHESTNLLTETLLEEWNFKLFTHTYVTKEKNNGGYSSSSMEFVIMSLSQVCIFHYLKSESDIKK